MDNLNDPQALAHESELVIGTKHIKEMFGMFWGFVLFHGREIYISSSRSKASVKEVLNNVYIFPKQVVIYKGKSITVIKR